MPRALRIAVILLVVSASFAAGWIRLPYFAMGPGPPRYVLPLIDVDGPPTYGSSGHLVLTTVRFAKVTPLTALVAWLDPDRTLVGEDVLYPEGLTPDEEERRAVSQMDQSKIDATVVVLSLLTRYPDDHARGALIDQVGEGCPAEGGLFPGDVIVRVDDERIRSPDEASSAIEAVPPGRPIDIRIRTDGEAHEVEVARGRCPGIREPLIGISTVEPFPFPIAIESDDVGGPSAGLMWALGLYDLLTPDDLTDGRTIAGTGTIDRDGKIGPVGGVVDKIVAARTAGADLLFVPKGNAGDLRGIDRGDLRVVAVGTFEEALEALGAPD